MTEAKKGPNVDENHALKTFNTHLFFTNDDDSQNCIVHGATRLWKQKGYTHIRACLVDAGVKGRELARADADGAKERVLDAGKNVALRVLGCAAFPAPLAQDVAGAHLRAGRTKGEWVGRENSQHETRC